VITLTHPSPSPTPTPPIAVAAVAILITPQSDRVRVTRDPDQSNLQVGMVEALMKMTNMIKNYELQRKATGTGNLPILVLVLVLEVLVSSLKAHRWVLRLSLLIKNEIISMTLSIDYSNPNPNYNPEHY
jgi:hypothetical protein